MAKKKTSKKTTANKKEIEFADGKNYISEEIQEAESLEKILGFNEKNPFGTSKASEFEEALQNMQLTELQEMAVNAGVFPSGTKINLKNKLKKAFLQFTQGGSTKVVQVTKPIVDPESAQGKALLKLIKEQ